MLVGDRHVCLYFLDRKSEIYGHRRAQRNTYGSGLSFKPQACGLESVGSWQKKEETVNPLPIAFCGLSRAFGKVLDLDTDVWYDGAGLIRYDARQCARGGCLRRNAARPSRNQDEQNNKSA